jgi:hypothetical protein
VEGKNNVVKETFNTSIGWLIDFKFVFSCVMLKLLVWQPVQMRTQHMYGDIKKKDNCPVYATQIF